MTMKTQATMGMTEWFLLLFLSVLWGGSFFFVGVAVDELPPFTIVFLRVGLAAILLHAVLLASPGKMPVGGNAWLAFFAMGLINNIIPFCLIVWGQTHIAGGLASILNSTTPLFTVLVAHGLTKDEKLTSGKLAGVLIGFGGVVVMIGPGLLQGLGTNILAQFAVLGAALSYSLAGIFGRRFHRMGITPMQTATGQVSASTIWLLPLVCLVDQPWTLPLPGLATWGAVVSLALLSTALAYIIYFRILAKAGATSLLLVTFLIPISASLLGGVFLGERLGLSHFGGMALIGLGLAAIDGRPWKSLSKFGQVRKNQADHAIRN